MKIHKKNNEYRNTKMTWIMMANELDMSVNMCLCLENGKKI